jgi:hypothetical protein
MQRILGPDGRPAAPAAGLVDPTTGLTRLHMQLMQLVKLWCSDDAVVAAIVGRDTRDRIIGPKVMTEVCLVGFKIASQDPKGLTEKELGAHVVIMLRSDRVRGAIAKSFRIPEPSLQAICNRIVMSYFADDKDKYLFAVAKKVGG